MDARIIAGFVGVGVLGVAITSVVLSANGATAVFGDVVLTPLNNSGISGTASLSVTHDKQTFITVQATGMSGLTNYAFALMSTNCGVIRQTLNPVDADAAGDGSSTSQINGLPDSSWWLGILNGDANPLACGQVLAGTPTVAASATPTLALPTATNTLTTTTPTTTATPAASATPTTSPGTTTPTPPPGTLVPVVTPTPLPAPTGTVTPPGS
jgi:hypothetical protein